MNEYERTIENFDIEHIREVEGTRNNWEYKSMSLMKEVITFDPKLKSRIGNTTELASRLNHLSGFNINVLEGSKAILHTELNLTREGKLYYPYGGLRCFNVMNASCAVGRSMVSQNMGSFTNDEEGRETLSEKIINVVYEFLDKLNKTNI